MNMRMSRKTEELDIGLAGMPNDEFLQVKERFVRIISGKIKKTDYCVHWPDVDGWGSRPSIIKVPEKYVGQKFNAVIRLLVLRTEA